MVKAIQFRGSPSQEIVEMTFDLPGLQAGEVLIRVTHSGLCGSELYMLDRPLVLGHEAIQFAAKMGCHVSVFSSTADKEEMARRLGAHQFYATRGVTDYTALGVDGPIDRLLVTSSAKADLAVLYPLLDRNAVIMPLSVGDGNIQAPYMPTILNKMLDFAARHHITCAVEHYPMTLQSVKDAMERLRKGTIRYRAVFSWDRARNGYCEDSHYRSGTGTC
ncbi:hypothetical protein ATERTT37_006314 [Aspergillus terreus]